MAAIDPSDIEERDKHFPYAELDKHSGKLRQAAFALAEGIAEIESQTNELKVMIQALSKINTSDIKVIDTALNNFKKALAGMVLRTPDSSFFGPAVTEDQLPVLLEKYNTFITETVALGEKAMELEDNS
jgi:hypothetical protein